ncbi:unnamed protein product [Symbiodinium pilosum]|uniref:Uncharacterized protein n=1 Tax=Symbiodinium pilosum TaxID=2952 RepID=A0A812IVH2_SYMPI|nr:unnamed protein product [Symbiodinium pilosum]
MEAEAELPESVAWHLRSLPASAEAAAGWRRELFMEYYYVDYNTKCVKNCSNASAYPSADSNCGDLANKKDCWCSKEQTKQEGCYYTESPANNFIALRDFEEGHHLLYSEFQTGELQKEPIEFDNVDFVELYNITSDPWQLRNLISKTGEAAQAAMHQRLRDWYRCHGASCP